MKHSNHSISNKSIPSFKETQPSYKLRNSTTLNMNTSIPILEQQLRILKQEQKKYNKLKAKLKDIEKKSKQMQSKQQSQSFTVINQNQQIQNLKRQIEECIKSTRKLQSETSEVNKQIQQSNKQLNSLQHMLNNLREQNKQKRNNIKQRGFLFHQKEKQLNTIYKERDICENDIQRLKLELEKLTNQQYKLRKQAEIVQFEQQQQQKAARKYQDHLEELKSQRVELQAKIGSLSQVLSHQQQKYKAIKQQLGIISQQQSEMIQQFHKKQSQNRQNKQKIIRSRAKIQSLTKEIEYAEQDMKLLSTEFSKQTDRLRQLEVTNNEINSQLDQYSRDAKQIWESLREALDVASGNQQIWSLDSLMKIRSQALQTWNQIQQIIH